MVERLRMSINFLSYMEHGLNAPSFENLERIAEVCGISVASLFEPPLAPDESPDVRP
jgi:transcriptional regulator with XRE-family HTH domain